MKIVNVILIISSLLLSFCENTQATSFDFVPVKYTKSSVVSSAERRKIISDVKNITDITLLLPQNYVEDGSVDYTDYVQNALNIYSNVLLPNFPLLINDKGLILKSGSTVIFNEKTVLLKKPSDKSNYDVLKIKGVKDVKVYFANIVGDRYEHLNKNGEWGHGIGIWSSNNIYLFKPKVKYGWGDGIYINNGVDVTVNKAFVNNNRRNGVSIISGKNITFNSLIAANSDGTEPKAGIDIEPNNNQENLKNININNLITYNCTTGLLVYLGALSGKESKKIGMTVNNHIDDSSVYALALYLDKREINYSNITGNIRINNSKWLNVKKTHILFNKKNGVKYNNIKVEISTIGTELNNDTQIKLRELNSN
ncbi:hypothetical protein [Chryseobacterium sp. MDT2-18]|uniref:hypothetical protein n=1 Tax=Chryseobacterium sp. MDT2-18 TaxID=1259136 RepID=UPI00277E6A2C|nr:hypothetical protein [Chryseobacterium sp. MDT2-18]MDQ0476444.1 hypothetical protein [Chryseobacterium sp. MDT2-18]